MSKIRYVIEVDTTRIPHQLNENEELEVSSKSASILLDFLKKSNMCFDARKEVMQIGVYPISLEIISE